jgi:hypothetical protein
VVGWEGAMAPAAVAQEGDRLISGSVAGERRAMGSDTPH